MTSRIPSLLNLTWEQERIFTRDKIKFTEFLKEFENLRDGGDDTFRLESEDGSKWIKITKK